MPYISRTVKMKQTYIVETEDELACYAQQIADQCPRCCIIALHGDLGAGKTTFVKYLGKTWNIFNVKSPSFGIIDTHQGIRNLIHVDAYRLTNGNLVDFGLDDLCTPPFCLAIEWPECLQQKLTYTFHLYFSILPNGTRKIIFESD